jgi:hypothetical protein
MKLYKSKDVIFFFSSYFNSFFRPLNAEMLKSITFILFPFISNQCNSVFFLYKWKLTTTKISMFYVYFIHWVFSSSSSVYSDRPVCAYYNHMYVCLQHHTYVDCFNQNKFQKRNRICMIIQFRIIQCIIDWIKLMVIINRYVE